ncbi:hypothetical protein DH2020_025895 [Rehmannia glutinosa]|uniref:DDE Tnp4 domain-containing protein n=1 Tax=Rehmannia glutinosa TaxID=99300 RepID=A0ABR0W0C0_REHGL
MYNSLLTGKDWLGELLRGHPNRISNSLRMQKNSFNALCNLLIERNLLNTNRCSRVGVRESVAIFLTTVGFSSRQRTTCERFQHSLETISRHVKRVAKALCKLAPDLIKPTNLQACPQRIMNDPLLYPYFKPHIDNTDITLTDWRGAMFEPKGPKNFFNKRHSRLRNAIERAFGVLKGRFPILKGPMPRYSFKRQVQIVIACCVLHNWLRANYNNDCYFRRVNKANLTHLWRKRMMPIDSRQSHQDIEEQSHFRDTLVAVHYGR